MNDTLPFPDETPDERNDREFAEYDAANPHVYDLFRTLARKVKARGFRVYSCEAIVQQLRWHLSFEVAGEAGKPFKIKNIFRKRLGRKLMREHPDEFKGFFRTLNKLRRSDAA